MYNKSSSMVKSNIIYDLIANTLVSNRPDDLLIKIWKFHLPLKIICFLWLSLLNKINTCDNLMKKGWIGPFWCCLCKSALESVDHLFHGCSFTRKVIALIRSSLDIPYFWRESNFRHNVSSWISLGNTLKYLRLLLAWQIWITRNMYF